ncbi:MAG: helix-hairpin-helix domain-containing protein [Clostridiales Family XIII bacterium]|nr:helix-hairpin-helix domain-containing protein [Clostridiales Family XIII bacterium]
MIWEDPRRRKTALIAAAAVIVMVIGAARYFSQDAAGVGDVISGKNQSVQNGQATESGVSADAGAEGAGDAQNAEAGASSGNAEGDGLAQAPAAAIFVDIGGAVANPGVIALPNGSRVEDAIEAAGGLTENANAAPINRAALLSDSDKVYIPTNEEVESGTALPSAGTGGDAGQSGAGGNSQTAQGKINLNTADSQTLQQLNGVGPATAQKIIDYRSANGAFRSIEEIMNVSGIGQKTFEKLKEYITV